MGNKTHLTRIAGGAALVAIVVGLCTGTAEGVLAFVATLLAGAAALGIAWRFTRPDENDERRFLGTITIASVALHGGIGLVICAVRPAVDYLGPDAVRYDMLANQIVNHWTESAPLPHISSGKEAFVYALGALYFVFGRHVAAGIAFNAICAGALVLVSADTTRRLFGQRAARITAVLTVVLPELLIWPSQLLREASVLLLVGVAINGAVRLHERFTLLRCLVVALSIDLLFSDRANVAAMLAIGLTVGALLAARELFMPAASVIVTAAFAALIMLTLGIGAAGFRYISELRTGDVDKLRNALSEAGSGIGSYNLGSVGGVARFAVQGPPEFMFGPFPWEVDSTREIPGLLDGLVMVLFLPSFLRGARVAIRRRGRTVRLLLVPAVLLIGGLGYLGGNFGFVIRERSQPLLLLLPFIALGLAEHPSIGPLRIPAGCCRHRPIRRNLLAVVPERQRSAPLDTSARVRGR